MASLISRTLPIRGAEQVSSYRCDVIVGSLGVDTMQRLRDSHQCELREILCLGHVGWEPPPEESQQGRPQGCEQMIESIRAVSLCFTNKPAEHFACRPGRRRVHRPTTSGATRARAMEVLLQPLRHPRLYGVDWCHAESRGEMLTSRLQRAVNGCAFAVSGRSTTARLGSECN